MQHFISFTFLYTPTSKKNVSITKENTSEDAEIGAALTAKAILQCLEVEECSDAVRPRPRTTSSEKSQLKLHAKSTLDISVYGSHSQQELVQSLKGPKLRSWILQIPPEFPREGKWTTFDARFEYLTQYFDQHGPVRNDYISCAECILTLTF